jgi:hypothetical protein
MPVSGSSAPDRTSNDSTARARSRCSAAPVRSLPRQARRPVTASTTAATAKPTARCTSSLSAGCATASAPAHTPSAEPQKARLSAKSCAASSATSRVRSSTPSVPPRPHHVAATDGLDHDHARQPRLRNQPNPHLTPIGTSQVSSDRPSRPVRARFATAAPARSTLTEMDKRFRERGSCVGSVRGSGKTIAMSRSVATYDLRHAVEANRGHQFLIPSVLRSARSRGGTSVGT